MLIRKISRVFIWGKLEPNPKTQTDDQPNAYCPCESGVRTVLSNHKMEAGEWVLHQKGSGWVAFWHQTRSGSTYVHPSINSYNCMRFNSFLLHLIAYFVNSLKLPSLKSSNMHHRIHIQITSHWNCDTSLNNIHTVTDYIHRETS